MKKYANIIFIRHVAGKHENLNLARSTHKIIWIKMSSVITEEIKFYKTQTKINLTFDF